MMDRVPYQVPASGEVFVSKTIPSKPQPLLCVKEIGYIRVSQSSSVACDSLPCHTSQTTSQGPSVCGQDLEKEVEHLDFPGSSWLTWAAPASAEAEWKVRQHLTSSSEPILDLKTEAAAVLPVNTAEMIPLIDLDCAPVATVKGASIFNMPVTTQDPAQIPKPPWDFSTAGYCDPELTLPSPPDKVPPSEAGSLGSLPWPEAPEECVPLRPNTLDLSTPVRKLEVVKQMGQARNSDDNIKENGLESCPEVPHISEERRALQSELGKCIEDFRKIKIPVSFPNKKRQWQNELLKKYQL